MCFVWWWLHQDGSGFFKQCIKFGNFSPEGSPTPGVKNASDFDFDLNKFGWDEDYSAKVWDERSDKDPCYGAQTRFDGIADMSEVERKSAQDLLSTISFGPSNFSLAMFFYFTVSSQGPEVLVLG